MRRRRRRQWLGWLLGLLLLAGLAAADRQGLLLDHRGDWERYHGRRGRVTRVIDGDTLVVALPDGKEPVTRIRLWGIDTPEMGWGERGRPAEPWAEEARAFAVRQCEGKAVRLLLQPHRQRDRYGRLLAYVELEDGRLLHLALLREGLAKAEERFDHDGMAACLRAQEEARRAGRGLWGR